MEYYWCYLDVVSPSCKEFNSLQKRYTALLHRTNTFFRKSYGRWSAEKLTAKFYLAPGVRNRKFYLAPGMRNGKIYLAPNDSYEKFYLAVKGLSIQTNFHWVMQFIALSSHLDVTFKDNLSIFVLKVILNMLLLSFTLW